MRTAYGLAVMGMMAACSGAPAARETATPAGATTADPADADGARAAAASNDNNDPGRSRGVDEPGRDRPADLPAGVAQLGFRVTAQQNGVVRALPPDATLRTGDRLAFTVSSRERAHVYLIQFFADGTSAVLFPEKDESNQVAGELRIPPSGWFQLDDVTGEEHFYLIASANPLSDADREIKSKVDRIRISGAEKPSDTPATTASHHKPADANDKRPAKNPKPHRPKAGGKHVKTVKSAPARDDSAPKGLRLETRGVFRVSDQGPPTVTVQADEQGVAIYRFSVTHVAR